jgi:hypothetical protein
MFLSLLIIQLSHDSPKKSYKLNIYTILACWTCSCIHVKVIKQFNWTIVKLLQYVSYVSVNVAFDKTATGSSFLNNQWSPQACKVVNGRTTRQMKWTVSTLVVPTTIPGGQWTLVSPSISQESVFTEEMEIKTIMTQPTVSILVSNGPLKHTQLIV